MTSNPEIRELIGEERAQAIYNLGSYAFHPSPPSPGDKEEHLVRIRRREHVRYFAAVNSAEVALSGAASSPMTQNVRGKIVPGGAIWGVATLPQSRRQGLCKAVMTALFSALHESGSALVNLYPFRESFYGRMGFVNLHPAQVVQLNPQALAPLLQSDLGGEVEHVLIGETYSEFRQFLYALQKRSHGMLLFDDDGPERFAENPFWLAKAMVSNKLGGVMLYNLQGEDVAHFLLRGRFFYAQDSLSRALLLSWIARHIDQADRVELILPVWERPETWYPDLEVRTKPYFIPPMGRILDLTRLEGLPVGAGRFTARILDPMCPWNDGMWTFDGETGALQILPGHSVECELSIQALSGLVFGVNDPGEFSVRGWGNPSSDLQERLWKMFSPRLVHLHEVF